MLNCIIIDDDIISRKVVNQMLLPFNFVNIVGDFQNALDSLETINTQKVDLIFLDVEMPGVSGFTFLKNLQNPPLVIIISSKKDYAFEAFEYNVVDYIAKPITEETLTRALLRANDLHVKSNSYVKQKDGNYFYVKVNKRLHKVNVADIMYVQAQGDYVAIHTKTQKYLLHSTIKSIEDYLKPLGFIRVHRSYIVALDQIQQAEEGAVTVNGEKIPVGDSYHSFVREHLKQL